MLKRMLSALLSVFVLVAALPFASMAEGIAKEAKSDAEVIYEAEELKIRASEDEAVFESEEIPELYEDDFEAVCSLMYSLCTNSKVYVAIRVETNNIPSGASEYGVMIDSTKYSAASPFLDGYYIAETSSLNAAASYTLKPYYVNGDTTYYADEFEFTTPSQMLDNGYGYVYEAGDNIAYRYSSKGIDVMGKDSNGSWLQSTYAKAGWPMAYNTVSTVYVGTPQVKKVHYNTVHAWVIPEISEDGYFVKIKYYVRNVSNQIIENFRFGSSADVQIGSMDSAPIKKTDYGLELSDDVNTFALILNEGYSATPVTTKWFGYYYYAAEDVYNNIDSDSLTGTDSGASYSWQNITLNPGEMKIYEATLGVGDSDTLNSLLKPSSVVDYVNEKLSGLESGENYKITCEGTTYELVADAEGNIPLSGTDKNSLSYNFIGKAISVIEVKDGEESESQDVEISGRPSAILPDYHTPDDTVPELPDDLDIVTTQNSIKIKAQAGQEYSIDGGSTWITPSSGYASFENLEDGTVYEILTRVAATSSSFASLSKNFNVKTSEMLEISDVTFTNKTVEYTGSAQSIVVQAEGAIASYSLNLAGPYSNDCPSYVNVGTYPVYYKLTKDGYHDYYNVVEFKITKASTNVITGLEIENWTYGESAKTPSVQSCTFGTPEYKYAGTGSTTYPESTVVPANAGTYKLIATVAETSNYVGARAEVSFNISGVDPAITAPTAKTGLVYNKAEQELVNAGSTTGGTMQYSLDGNTWSTSLPKGKDAKTYKVYYKVAGDGNYSDNDGGYINVTIGLADMSMGVSSDGYNGIYDGEVHCSRVVLSGDAEGAIVKYGTVEGTYNLDNAPEYTDVCNTVIYYEVTKDNYNTVTGSIPFIISPKNIENAEITLGEALIYNGTEQTQTIASVEVDGILVNTYTVSGNTATNYNASGYVLTITGNGNFAGSVQKEYAIAQATPIQNPDKLTTAKIRRGASLSNATVTNGEFLSLDGLTPLSGEYTWVDDTETISATEIKRMTFTPSDSNYLQLEFDVEVSILATNSAAGAVRCAVSFETNGGSKISNTTVSANAKLPEPPAPVKEGYIFAGWYSDSKLTQVYNFDNAVTKSFTLYAKWEDESETNDVCDGTGDCASLKFSDLDVEAWYHLDTDYVIEKGIFKGMSETEFWPSSMLTRAMLVTVLYRIEGEPEVNSDVPFIDVDNNGYYADALCWAWEKGIVLGMSETEFAPQNNITREQIATIMFRYSQYKGMIAVTSEENLHFADSNEISAYAVSAMNWAVGTELIVGRTQTTVNPKENATRAEVAAILHRYLESGE